MARRVSKWDCDCDRRLHMLVSYINSTADFVQRAYVGDQIGTEVLTLFCDADFAGDRGDSKSTSGVFVAIAGPTCFVPVACLSKKQGCVSTSTCEAEIVAMAAGLKEVLSCLDMWEVIVRVFHQGGSGGEPSTKSPSIGPSAVGRPSARLSSLHLRGQSIDHSSPGERHE